MKRKPATKLLDPTFKCTLDAYDALRFAKIDRLLIENINKLKEAIAELDCYRPQWAQIISCDNPPGRGSEYQKRLEMMQGYAMQTIDSACLRLSEKIRGPK